MGYLAHYYFSHGDTMYQQRVGISIWFWYSLRYHILYRVLLVRLDHLEGLPLRSVT